MRMGNSGAIINVGLKSVEKIGGRQDLNQQAALMSFIGYDICPIVIGPLPNSEGYVMEKCRPCPPIHSDQTYRLVITDIIKILEKRVWGRHCFNDNPKWKHEIREWITEQAPWISPSLFAEASRIQNSFLMHGDPTLSNVMFRNTGSDYDTMLISDPIGARTCVPSNDTVDYGKLLQSCMGWEHILDKEWVNPTKDLLMWMIRTIPEPLRAASLFWGAYHCARIASLTENLHRATWGRDASKQLAQEGAQCCLPTI